MAGQFLNIMPWEYGLQDNFTDSHVQACQSNSQDKKERIKQID
jgi:hypothetical protein